MESQEDYNYNRRKIIMNNKSIFLVLLLKGNSSEIVGIFSSIKDIEDKISKFSKKKSYKVYEIPLNQYIISKNNMENNLEKYLYNYLGTFPEASIEVDDAGNLKKETEGKVTFWP
jgi:hypothetical protein